MRNENSITTLHATAVAAVALNATSNTDVTTPSQSEHPFGRYSKVNRTPPSVTVNTILINDLVEQIYRLVNLLEDGNRRSIH